MFQNIHWNTLLPSTCVFYGAGIKPKLRNGEEAPGCCETKEQDSLKKNHLISGKGLLSTKTCPSLWIQCLKSARALYFKAQPPALFFFKEEQTFTTKIQEQSILIFLTNGPPHATGRSSICSMRQPSPLSGKKAKWPHTLSAADHKYWKEINFSEWKAPFFVF